MIRYAALALALLLAACGPGFINGSGRVPGNTNLERPDRMPSNAEPQPSGSLPR